MRRTFLASSFALSLLACADPSAPTSTVDKPNDGKEDSISRLCEELGEPATCDPCDAAGWYGDGECDTFCATPDTQDCPVTEAAAFLARTDLATSYRSTGYPHVIWFVATELSQTTADTWTDAEAALVGNGLALHIRFAVSGGVTTVPKTIAIESSVGITGECLSYLEPETLQTAGEARVNIFHWSGATATPLVCSRGGAVIAKRVDDKVQLQVLAELSDGSTIEQTFEADVP